MFDDEPDDDEDSLPTRELHRIAGGACHDCRTPFTAKEAVWSIALGFKNAPRCLNCLCRRLGREETDLRTSLTEYVHRRECYLRAWREAETMDAKDQQPRVSHTPEGNNSEADTLPSGSQPTEVEWDAGDLGCGDLVMQLRIRLKNLPAGSVFRVTATDPAAPEDIPAWCRLTGHTLLTAAHPLYTIRRRED
ncbi:MAG: sulfurtransferase TusA family protein [Fimbriiglobus sp.]|nr:sulfurtransferase TusA family protein [Fimbriiglobus sp.]